MQYRLPRLLFVSALLALSAQSRAQYPRGTVCEFPDLGGMTPVAFEPGAASAAGTGGEIPGGRWELVALRYDFFLTVAGEATGAFELAATDASSGVGSAALQVTITEPAPDQIDETGAGPYSATGNSLEFQNDCGDALLLGETEYTVDTSGAEPVMTLWGDIDITDPFPTTIPIEAEFLLVEPANGDGAVFQDRFESP